MDHPRTWRFTVPMDLFRNATLVVAVVTIGLFAGLFYAFSCAVMVGLRRTDDRTFVSTMQSINIAIVNGWFMVSFLGAGVATALAGVLHVGHRPLPWIVAGFVLWAATIAITRAVNIPLNNALDAAGPVDSIADLAAVREHFEVTWVRWNLLRAVVSTGALGCLAIALLRVA